MTCVARVRECRRLVIGVRSAVVGCHVATGTDEGQSRVVVVHVAHGAGNRGRSVVARQRERSVVVVKRGIHPVDCVMAHITGLREANLNVVRGICGLIDVQVARHTGRVSGAQAVVAVHVALCALRGGMHARQREAGARMVEGGSSPVSGVVALLAGLREVGRNVARVVRGLEIR